MTSRSGANQKQAEDRQGPNQAVGQAAVEPNAAFTAPPREWVQAAPGVEIMLERDHPTTVRVRRSDGGSESR